MYFGNVHGIPAWKETIARRNFHFGGTLRKFVFF